MDFIDRLKEVADAMKVPIIIYTLDQTESIRLSSQAGGRTIRKYRNGDAIKELPFEFVFKTEDDFGDRTMSELAELLEEVEDLPSKNNSYQFMGLTIVNEPFFAGKDKQNYLYYRLVIQAKLYIKKLGE
jgi:superfamily II DNA or RNA helicase